MNSTTLYHINTIKQDARMGIVTKKGLSLTFLLHNLIREYGKYSDGCYLVDVDNFSIADKRLLLSHFESPEWYAYACESEINTEALFNECKAHIESLIADECCDVYQEDMEEAKYGDYEYEDERVIF